MSCLPIATQAEAEAGTTNDKTMTPLRTMQAIDALGVSQDALALPNGGTMVGYRADAAAVSTSMSARLQREVWVEDYITDPGIGTDNYTAFATAIAEAVARGVSTVRFNGRYRTENTIVIPSGIRLIGDGCHYRYLNSVSVRAGICGRTFIPSIADFYYAGFYVLPTVDNGYTYKVTAVAGACGAEPVWPTVIGNTVVSGGVTFQCAGVSALVKGTGGIQA